MRTRRRSISEIVRTTALEVLSEPLSLLLLLSALALAVLAPALHYHQFGEATRMARDAGLSALFLCGSAQAVFVTIRAFRREIETHTYDMALAHAISPNVFFFAKTAGAFLALLVFDVVVFAVTLVIVRGAAIGGALAAQSGLIARVWGPSLALGTAVIVLPLLVAAALNRFAKMRFVPTCFAWAFAFALLVPVYRFNGALAVRLLFAALPLVAFEAVLLSAAAACAMRFRANVSAAGVAVVFAALLPFAGNFYLSDALARGGSVAGRYVAECALFAASLAAAFLLCGAKPSTPQEGPTK